MMYDELVTGIWMHLRATRRSSSNINSDEYADINIGETKLDEWSTNDVAKSCSEQRFLMIPHW